MLLVASFSALIFFSLSGLHVYWMFGGKWGMNSVVPTKEGITLDKIFVPSFLATMVVALGLFTFGIISLGGAGVFSYWIEISFFRWGNVLIAFIFLLRAIGDFKYVGFFKKIRNSPFARNDSSYYSPLCLFIAILSLWLGLTR